MILCHEKRFLFVAVPKTGSTSIESALAAYGDHSPFGRKHASMSTAVKRLGPGIVKRYLAFCVVRHPVDWVLSWYAYRSRSELSDPEHRHHQNYSGLLSLEDFLQSFVFTARPQSKSRRERGLGAQRDKICDRSGTILVDKLCRYENLERDFQTVMSELGIDAVDLPLLNESPSGKKLVKENLDPALYDKIANHYERDMALFGYE